MIVHLETRWCNLVPKLATILPKFLISLLLNGPEATDGYLLTLEGLDAYSP